MEKDEIEMGTLPKDVHLPRLVMTHLYIYCAPEDGKDYVVYFITDITSQREFVRGLLDEWCGVRLEEQMNKIDYLRMIAKCLENILTAIHQILKKKGERI